MTTFTNINSRKFRRNVKKAEKFFNRTLPKSALKEFKKQTPIDRGNARRKTTMKKTAQGFEIFGNYAYSGVLDKGLYPNPPKGGQGKTRGGYSKQAPKGMVEPTIKYLRREVRKFIGRLR
ncbi:MAG: hypothetical protein GY886_01835 [Gammaproteobacteria bacterium]|nr:hypothetical protein [Gammaproteobacteria bacterium]